MGYVYKYTIRETGKWYVGSHNGKKKKYSGSGLLWVKAKEKYGPNSYDKEILYEGCDYRKKEEEILKELDAANNPMSYNMKNEALGGSFPGEKNGMFGKKLTKEQKYKCGKGFRGKKRPDHSKKMFGENNPMYNRNQHCHGIVNYAKSNSGKKYDEIYGKENSILIREKISKAHMGKSKPGTSKAMKGSGNSSAKKVTIDNVEYGCIKEAMKATGLSRYMIRKLCNVK